MSNTLLINSNGYVQSQNIKVFPCAYRGYYEAPTEGSTDPTYKIINPEARTTSEYSFVNSYHKLSATKESYVISWTPPSTAGASNGVLKFVIGGYYFEITNCTLEDFITTENNNTVSKTFYINIKNNGNLPGQYLGSFESDVRWLDEDTGTENKLEDFYFTGLKISTSNISSEASRVYSLTPFASQYQHWRTATSANLEEVLSDIKNLTTAEQSLVYYTDEETNNYSALKPTAASFTGTVLFYKQVFDINPAALPITNLLDSGSGKYSLKMLEDTENGINNTTTASGDYSVALGKRTEASGLVSTALGNLTKASGETSLAVGNTTEASGINSFASGNNTQAQGTNSVTTGSYTQTSTSSDNSFAGGQNTRANGVNSFAFGENAIATGRNAISVGYKAPNTSNVGAYGQNSITAGVDTKTTTEATNAVAIGNTTIAAGVNSFVGGNHSEANNENSFAFGNNVTTNASNQVVFGKYNLEDNTQAFIIANGTDEDTKSNKFTVSYDGDVNALGSTTIGGNLTTTGNAILGGNSTTNVVNIKTTPASGEVNVKITGSAKITSTTTINGAVGINKDTESNSKTTGALIVAGGAGIGKKLNVGSNLNVAGTATIGGTTTINNNLITKGNITANKEDAGGTAANNLVLGSNAGGSSGTISIYGTAANAKVFEVANTGNTTITGNVNITNTTGYSSSTTGEGTSAVTTHSAALKVDGGVHIGQKLNVVNNTTIGGTLSTTGEVTVSKDTDYTYTNDTHSAALKVTGGVHIGKKLNVASATTIGGATTISGVTSITNDTDYAAAAGETPLAAALKVTGGMHVGKKLNVATDATIGGTLTATGDTTLQGKVEIEDELTLNTNLFVDGNLHLKGTSSAFELFDGDNSVVTISKTEAILPETNVKGNLELDGKLTADDATSEHQIGSIKITGGEIEDVATLTASGTITASVFNATSDLRKKTNIKEYKCEKSILDLPIKSFEYINDESHTNYIGCIAQDLQEICPELVNKDADGFLSIQETKLIYLLLQEVRELKEKVTKLERR